ncbi:MAG: ABC transporter ATP-binding protein [Spirochaeta sp.]
MQNKLLEVRGLRKTFPVKASPFSGKNLSLKAVDGVDMDIYKGETIGLVGESGCGKTTIGRCLLRLYEPDAGRVYLDPESHRSVIKTIDEMDAARFELSTRIGELESAAHVKGTRPELRSMWRESHKLRAAADKLAAKVDILSMGRADLKAARKRIQMVFQDPWASLNPMMLVKDLVAEGPREFGTHKGAGLDRWVGELLDKVGLPRAAANRYPHEFSGGQRQRICIARALAVNPSLIVCDEPVSALDVSIQAQVLNLLISLQDDFDLTYVFIAHDLSVVQYISDKVAVMYLGKMAEKADAHKLYANPRHPYTISLLSSVPVADPDYTGTGTILQGDVPSPINPPSGCSFHPRCPNAIDRCRVDVPKLEKNQDGHVIACHNPPNG